jgi:hypothetical protein
MKTAIPLNPCSGHSECNRDVTPTEQREEGQGTFFECEREVDPDIFLWDSCVFACENVWCRERMSAMPISQRALNLSLAAMRRLYSAWRGLTTLRKAIVVGIALAAVMAALKNAFDVFAMLVLPCTVLLLLVWGASRFFGLMGGSKWSENVRVALALAVVVGFFLFCGFMAIAERRIFRHAELNAEMQEIRMERNKLRIGMTINDVLPRVHGMDIDAYADGDWLSVLPDNKRFYYEPGLPSLLQHDDGTFTFRCYCGTEQVSRKSRVTASQVLELIKEKPEQEVKNLTESQAAALMKQKMSDGFDWSWKYKTFKHSRQ